MRSGFKTRKSRLICMVNLYGEFVWENQFFKPDYFENWDQEGGNLGAGGFHIPESYM